MSLSFFHGFYNCSICVLRWALIRRGRYSDGGTCSYLSANGAAHIWGNTVSLININAWKEISFRVTIKLSFIYLFSEKYFFFDMCIASWSLFIWWCLQLLLKVLRNNLENDFSLTLNMAASVFTSSKAASKIPAPGHCSSQCTAALLNYLKSMYSCHILPAHHFCYCWLTGF